LNLAAMLMVFETYYRTTLLSGCDRPAALTNH
jgi:hypothetical protein